MNTVRITLNPFSTEPLYRQLKGTLKTAILSGQFVHHSALPTMVELMHLYGISSTVINKAYDQLENDGLIYRIRGKGTFVRYVHRVYLELPLELAQLVLLQKECHVLTGFVLKEGASETKSNASVQHNVQLNRTLCIKSIPAYQEIFMPQLSREIMQRMIDDGTFFAHYLNTKMLQAKSVSLRHQYTVTMSSEMLEKQLQLSQPTPLHIVMTYLHIDDILITIRTYCHGERLVFKFGLPV
jgi:DNA-binding GntR family transcriptional regulator